MIGDLLDVVHRIAVKEIHDAVGEPNCEQVLTINIKTVDGVLELLLVYYFALDGVPFDQKLVLSSSEELVFTVGSREPPKLFVEMTLHNDVGI